VNIGVNYVIWSGDGADIRTSYKLVVVGNDNVSSESVVILASSFL